MERLDNLDRITTALEELVRLAKHYVDTAEKRAATAQAVLDINARYGPNMDVLSKYPPDTATNARTAQERADYHSEHAAELFGTALYRHADGRWYEKGTAKPVVFTMYGWILEEDMR
jgi:hypothetical protein